MIKLAPLTFVAAATISLLPLCGGARAQDEGAPKVEVGAQFTALSLTRPEFSGTENLPGFGGRLTYNFSDHLAVEAELNFMPDEIFSEAVAGGRAVQGQFGVKAGRRFEKFGVFAKARPGFISFGDVLRAREGQTTFGGTVFPIVEFDRERGTHFSMDVGGVLEFYPSRRLLVRFDAGDTVIRYGERKWFSQAIVLGPLDQQEQHQLLETLPAETHHHFQFSAGVGFRFRGGDRDGDEPGAAKADDSAGDVPRYEVGAQFSSLSLNEPEIVFGFPLIPTFDPGTDTEFGFGGRLTFNLNDCVGLEAEGNFYPRHRFPGQTFGGYPSQAQFGAKVGRRWEKFGVFGKARPGFVSFGEVRQLVGTRPFTLSNPVTGGSQTFTLGVFDDRRKTYFSMDMGGVVELYPSRRVVTRFDFGDTIIRYGLRHEQGFSLSRNIIEIPPETKHNFQFSAGIGFRF